MSGASITLANLSDISENTIYYPFDGYYYDKCFASHEPESPKGSSK